MDTLNVTNAFLDSLRPRIVTLDNTEVELRADTVTNGSQRFAGVAGDVLRPLPMMSSNHVALECAADNTANVPLLIERTRRVISSRRLRNPRE